MGMKQIVLIFSLLFLFSNSFAGKRTGWGWGGVPALNYNADDGFGYGALLNLFNYKDGSYDPYYLKIKPIIFFTTGGKQDHTFFIDSPYMLKGWRFNFRIRYKREIYFPFYGFGNDSKYNEGVEDKESDLFIHDHYYSYQSRQLKCIANFQKALIRRSDNKPKYSLLLGFGIADNANELENEQAMVKKYINQGKISDKEFNGYFNSYIKAGLIYDTRDNEPAPNEGAWTSLLLEGYSGIVGSESDFARVTLTDRRYFRLVDELVFANRIVVETLVGDAPFSMYYPFGGSYRADEGIGGYRTIRGQLKNRYLGTEKFFVNMELRYRFYDFSFLNQDFYLAANGFVDFGRVWHADDETGGMKNLKFGKGGGVHIGWNENFIVYGEIGFGHEAGAQLYVDIGYLF